MSALAVAHPHTSRPRVARLHPVPDLPPEAPVTVTISIAGAAAGRERVFAVLRDLVEAAGPAVSVELDPAAPAPDGAIRLDPHIRTAVRDGRPLDLSRLEFDLLLFLARHPRQVFSRTQLLTHVWGHTHTTNRTVDVHVSRLRTKLDDADPVTTVYGLGYRLADEAAIAVVGHSAVVER
jgi:two-component system response regulator MtrA